MQNCAVPLLPSRTTAMRNFMNRCWLSATAGRHRRIPRQMERGLKGCGWIWCRDYVA